MKKKIKQRIIDISTIPGLNQAERLKSRGWTVISAGFNTITMQSPL